jgi:alpha-galactosidase
MRYQIKYKVGEEEFLNDSAYAKVYFLDTGEEIHLSLIPKEKVEVELLSAQIFFDERLNPGERFLANGYQTWTETKEHSVFSHTRHLGFLARIPYVQKKFHVQEYGDSLFTPYMRHYSFSYTYLRKGEDFRLFGSLSERSGYTVFYLKGGKLCAYKDIAGIKAKAAYRLFDLAVLKGQEDEVFEKYARLFGKEIRQKGIVKGFTTWYRYYEKIDEEKFADDIKVITEKKLDFDYIQLDDGYESKVGDWLEFDQTKFSRGLKPLVGLIKEGGYKPGIWIAPFAAAVDSKLYKDHPDWVLRYPDGTPAYGGANWGGFVGLDIDKKEVRDYLHEVFAFYKSMGFVLFKLDFLYACCQVPHNNKSRGQLMTEAMEFLRSELDDCKILGCGVPLFPAFFNVDYCRIGCDIGPSFHDKFIYRHLGREIPRNRQALKNAQYRRELDQRFFLNDPDVMYLRGTKMTQEQKERIINNTLQYGSVYLTSDDVNTYSSQDIVFWKDIKKKGMR